MVTRSAAPAEYDEEELQDLAPLPPWTQKEFDR
jgi:hypothetical protein